jgi:hypothetical protein
MAKRKLGDIPDRIKGQPVTLANYDLKMEWYGAIIKKWGDNWPFLSHDEDAHPATGDEIAWDRYFRQHLGGYPKSYQLFRKDVMKFYNVPEKYPELFDMDYKP